ncbi:MAG TPA: deoxyribose-phosphate aldolase [Acidimicrobiia bacterium]|nr:deoxyribose-phosphate aldolase [Acidimicrobiia bacterium]
MTILDDGRYEWLLRTRAERPGALDEAAASRSRRAVTAGDGRLLIVAFDHPARRIMGVGSDGMAMAHRRDALDRCIRALRRPGVDGLLATPDLAEDLLLLGELDDKIVFGSMNRGGLTGSAWELDDRFTAYRPEVIERLGFEGGKMLLRIDYDDPHTIRTLEACARAVDGLADRRLIALVEPLPARRDAGGRVRVTEDPDLVIEAISIASALGSPSVYTWLKLPASSDPDRMMSATTLPSLLLGGDPGAEGEDLLARWRRAMAIPHVRGLTAGRSLLYPQDGAVERWVDAAVAIVHGEAS